MKYILIFGGGTFMIMVGFAKIIDHNANSISEALGLWFLSFVVWGLFIWVFSWILGK